MENPFVKLVREGEEPSVEKETELSYQEERMSPEDKEKRLAEFREWRAQVETGMKMEAHPDDAEQLEKIDEEIRKLEQK